MVSRLYGPIGDFSNIPWFGIANIKQEETSIILSFNAVVYFKNLLQGNSGSKKVYHQCGALHAQ
jgi:hypothetical protein